MYKLVDEAVPHRIFMKCKMKFGFDLEPFYDKETRTITIDNENTNKIIQCLTEFLLPLGLAKESKDE
jgi:hypothetical protein